MSHDPFLAGRRYWRWALAAGALVLVDAVRLPVLPAQYQESFTDGFEAAIAVFCVFACIGAAIRSTRFRRAQWTLVVAFFLALTAADLHDLLVEVLGQGSSGFALALELLGWCTYLPLAFLVVFPAEEEEGSSPWSWLAALDFLQVTLVVVGAYFSYIYLPHAESHQPWTIRSRPEDIRNLILSAGLLFRAAADPSSGARAFYLRVGGAFALITVVQGLFTRSAHVVDLLARPAALLALALLALRWDESERRTPRGLSQGLASGWSLGLLPAAGPLVLLSLGEGAPERYVVAVWSAIGLSIAVFIARTGVSEQRRRAAERERRWSEERFRVLFERSLAGVFRSTREGRILDCNDALVQMLGFDSKEELLALAASRVYAASEDRAAYVAHLEREGKVVNDEMRLLRKDGAIIWVLTSSSLTEGIIEGVVVDVTERTRAEKALALFRTLVDRTNDGIEVIDPETGRFLDVNETACRTHGYSREEYRTVERVRPGGRNRPVHQ